MLLIRYLIKLGCVVSFFAGAHAFAAKSITIEEFTLSNGLEVILVPNHRVPAVSHMLWLRVGAADDPLGKSGLAHYHEHLMFKATKDYKDGEFTKRIEAMGGELNAFTGNDYTGYYVNIATEHLGEVMALEADRMQHLVPSEQDYDKERAVIIEERQSRIENKPAALLAEQVKAALFQHHPYQTPTIGWMHEMKQLSAQDAKGFYKQFYHAGNMLLVVAGDMDVPTLKKLAEKYYGTLPAKMPYQRNWVQEPPQRAARHVRLVHELVQQPQWSRTYVVPGYVTGVDGESTDNALPLALLAQWLGGGETSLLYQRLVREQKVAVSASAYYSGMVLGPGTFGISVAPAPQVELSEVEAAVNAVLEEVLKTQVPPQDMQRIQTLFKAEATYAREGLQPLAQFVGMLKMLGMPLSYLQEWETRVEAVRAEQLQEAAQLLRLEASVTSELLPEETP